MILKRILTIIYFILFSIFVKGQNFPQAPTIPQMNFPINQMMNSQQMQLMNLMMLQNYTQSADKLLEIEYEKLEKFKFKSDTELIELNLLKSKITEFEVKNLILEEKEVKKTKKNIINTEQKIEKLNLKIKECDETILTLKSNIETISKIKEAKEKEKLEKKVKKTKKLKKIDNSDYEDLG